MLPWPWPSLSPDPDPDRGLNPWLGWKDHLVAPLDAGATPLWVEVAILTLLAQALTLVLALPLTLPLTII